MSGEKDRFLVFFDEVCTRERLSCREVFKRINDHYDIPEGTFNDTVSRSKSNLNTMVVIAFCKTFGYDIYQIYLDRAEDAPSYSARAGNAAIDPELPDNFYGCFYGYFFSSTPEYLRSGHIDQFTLNIQRGYMTLLLRRYALNVEAGNQYAPSEVELKGMVVHNPGGAQPRGVLVLSFTSEGDAHFCTIAYNKCQLNGHLFFRRGALLIQSRGEEVLPTIQSFIFTRQKIDLDDGASKTALQGALTLIDPASRMILLKKRELECFMDSTLMKKYFKNRAAYDGACEEYVELDEDRLLRVDVDNMELYQTLFQIKSKAANAKLYTFPVTDRSWHYIGTLCRREESYEQEQ